MKTLTKPLPPVPTLEPQSNFELQLKAGFIAAALEGICSEHQGQWTWTPEHAADVAYEIGSMVYERFADEHFDVVRRFNRKVGLE